LSHNFTVVDLVVALLIRDLSLLDLRLVVQAEVICEHIDVIAFAGILFGFVQGVGQTHIIFKEFWLFL
jgi:hypothetical protein